MSRDEGSILPLILVYGVLALALIVVTVDATSLYLAHKRLDSLADAAALAAADSFQIELDEGVPRAVLTAGGIQDAAAGFIADAGDDAWLVSASTPDGVSARVTVGAVWKPPILSPFVSDGLSLTSSATARNALG
ncbi:hypothetical protein GCM10009808_04700 [Microbacterium sediminicola]|uniref:Putative Flp pilus-assembly TadG-like N-terminal domain-containing protein n=1 Tax=Microbacterium sediminicola TaxID=415210 RepID=A0ABP4TNF5_9MICO